jgi:hypothetical protein
MNADTPPTEKPLIGLPKFQVVGMPADNPTTEAKPRRNTDPASPGPVPRFVHSRAAAVGQEAIDRDATRIHNLLVETGSSCGSGIGGMPTPGNSDYLGWQGPKVSELTPEQVDSLAAQHGRADRPFVFSEFIEDRLWAYARQEAFLTSPHRSVVQADNEAAREFYRRADIHEKAHTSPGFKHNHGRCHAALGLPQPPGYMIQGALVGGGNWSQVISHTHQPDGTVEWEMTPLEKTAEERRADDLAPLLARIAALEAAKTEAVK